MDQQGEVQGPAAFPAWYVNEKIEQLTKDPLTGILNQAAWDTAVRNRMRSAEQGTAQPALFFLDIDRFKKLNDNHGHLAGNEFILAVVEMLRDSLRHDDTQNADLARIGGDEFGILVDLTPRNNDTDYSPEERLKLVEDRIQSKVVELLNERYPEYRDLGVNLAIGASIWKPGDSAEEFIKLADANMYALKAQHHELSAGNEAA